VASPAFDAAAIARIIPHRFPFLFVDRILDIEPGRRIVGVKHVAGSERYLSSVAGGAPVLPTTLLLEAVAQVGAILVLSAPEHRDDFIYLAGIDRIRQRRPVRAGETVMIEAVMRRIKGAIGQMSGTATVEGARIAYGSMKFAIIPPPNSR
jgi:3-hydroxyacyl-[acyl-carrier-protein] dehydratase